MELERLVVARRIGKMEQDLLSPEQAVINQVLYGLDLVAHRVEMKWGVGRLTDLAPQDLLDKWLAQESKLNEAILESNVEAVKELVLGSIRGYAALEAAAVAAGHVPYEPQFWEVNVEGRVYRVVRTVEDAHALHRPSEALGRPVVTLEELVRVLHAKEAEAFKTPPPGLNEYVATGKPMDERLDDI